ncbi:MAG: CapA family protein [Bacteroidales bacterium]|nr:CapA family protein [Bacteroidales bacterium]
MVRKTANMILLMAGVFLASQVTALSQTGDPEEIIKSTPARVITIAAVGDIMLGTSYPSTAFLPPAGNLAPLFGALADTLAAAGIAFGNLEGCFLNYGDPVKKCRDSLNCYLFRTPESYSGMLADAGLDIVSLANNHIGDFGDPGRKKTKYLLDSLGINYAGLTEKPWAIFERDSLKIGFCAFAPNSGTVSLLKTDEAAAIVRFLNDTCDIVIVSFHGGAEGADNQRVPRTTEYHVGEDRGDVYLFARLMIDNGADVVFGHGPHVTRAIDLYKDRFIAYSLGNFLTYSRFNITGPNALAPIAAITVDSAGRFVSGRIIPGYQIKGVGVRYDTEKRAIKKIRELIALDFPDSLISLSDEGVITYKKP